MRLNLRRHSLSNGLRVVLAPDPAVPVVGLALAYDVGSRDEVPGRSGFAHLFEHLMFQGSQNVAKGGHMELVQSVGGRCNGSTSEDQTVYTQVLPSRELDLGLWLEADRMQALALTQENFENQRSTVIEERRERVDDSPYGLASLRLKELSWRSWAYAHPVVGSFEDLDAATLDDARTFHGAFYRPDNAVLALAGQMDEESVLQRLEAWFGPIEAGGAPPRQPIDEEGRSGAHERQTDPLARLPAVFVNHPCGGFGHEDFFALEMLETVLLRGPSSRAWRRLVVDRPIALQVGGGFDAHRGPGLFGLSGVVSSEEGLEPLRAGWQELLDEVSQQLIPDDEWAKAITRVRSARVFGLESPLAQAAGLARAELSEGNAEWENDYLDGIAAVTPDAVREVAARCFASAAAVVMEVVPA